MDKRGVTKVGLTIFVVIFLLIFIFQINTILSSNQDITIPSRSFFVGGGGISKNSFQDINPLDKIKKKYGSNNTVPIVTLIEPKDNSIDDDGEIEFIFSVQDDGLLRDCILYNDVSGEWSSDKKNKNTFIQPNYPLHFNVKKVLNGHYNWNILCTDDAFNINSNNNFSFTINKIPPQVLPIPDLSLKEDGILMLNLSEYFFDPKGDELTYDVEKNNNVKIKIDKKTNMATLEPKKNWFGDISLVFTAFDEHGSQIESPPVKISISEEGDTPPRFISTLSKEGEVDTDGYLFLQCNVTDDKGLREISLYSDTSGTWKLEETKEFFEEDIFTEFLISDVLEGSYEWACMAKDNFGQESWSEKQNVEVRIDVKIVHNIFDEIVNNVEYPVFVGVEYSRYLNESIILGDLRINKENGEEYVAINMSNQQKSGRGDLIRSYKKIIISPNDIFNNGFKKGNKETLKFVLEYFYLGERLEKEFDFTIQIKEGGWIL